MNPMSKIPKRPRKVLLLSFDYQFFHAAKVILQARGFDVVENLEDNHVDAALMEPFFLHSGLADYLRLTRKDIPVLAICTSRHEDEIGSVRLIADETIVLPHENWHSANAAVNIGEAFDQSQYLQLLRCDGREFGTGLWAFMMQQVVSPSAKFARFV